ncbi:MAG: hypothetical protein JWM65_3274 [Sphingomonas bacterium]|nr:hypothetical protein [Sphingomonas bacterium]
MARADRLERLDARRVELEAAYNDVLIAALRKTAAGSWGLFGHRKDRQAEAKYAPVIAELTETGEAIDAMRAQLGIEPFALHRDFLASRGPVASSAAGEPKQAQAWLERLGLA